MLKFSFSPLERAQYGRYLMKELSQRLTKQYGRGFSIPTLKNAKQFYLGYYVKR